MDSMGLAPNSGNYFYGRGKLFFDRFDTDESQTGLLHLGLIDSLALSMSTTIKELEGSISGPKEVLKSVEVGPRKWTGEFTARDWSKENLLLAIGGDEATTQTTLGGAGGAVSGHLTVTQLDRYQQIYYTQSAVEKECMQIAKYDKSTTPWTPLAAPVVTHGSTTFVEGTDYDIDYEAGLIIFYSASANTTGLAGSIVTVSCKIYNTTMSVLSPAYRMVRGKLLYVGTNECGPRFKLTAWDVTLTLKTKLDLIANDFGKLDFGITINADKTNHPLNPYFQAVEMIEGSALTA